jgi:hypothetical protein
MRQAAADKVRAELDSRATAMEAARKERLDLWAAGELERQEQQQQRHSYSCCSTLVRGRLVARMLVFQSKSRGVRR